MFPPIHYERNFYNGYLLKDADITTVVKAIHSICYDNMPFYSDDFSKKEALTFTKNIVTKREREIIHLIADELTVDDIATQLHLSKHTVETHKKTFFLSSK